jgi:tripartite-type tricarboxylate transporter receptor subunit TctC
MFKIAAIGLTGGAGASIVLSLPWATGSVAAGPVEDFYKGRTVDLVVGSPAGGGYDTFGRLIALYMGNHIPGNPRIVPQNMTGAGGLLAANHLYNSARKDGTEFGTVASSVLMEPLFGNTQAHFDSSKFTWLGSANQTVSFCGVNPSSQISSLDQWLSTGKELKIAASGVGAISYQHPVVLKNVLGANVKMISGYSGGADFVLSVERGETDGFCSMDVTSIEGLYKPLFSGGKMKLIVQMGPFKDSTFDDVPSVFDFAKTDEQQKILSIAFDQLALGRPFMAPPGIPEERSAALSKAFEETLKDPAFLADGEKLKLSIDYVSGERSRKMLEQFANYPAELRDKARVALGE